MHFVYYNDPIDHDSQHDFCAIIEINIYINDNTMARTFEDILLEIKSHCTLSPNKPEMDEDEITEILNNDTDDIFLSNHLSEIRTLSEEFVSLACGPRSNSLTCNVYDAIQLVDNPTSGFECNNINDTCNKRYGKGTRGIIPFMAHVLQDVFLFRNLLKIPMYVNFFESVLKRETMLQEIPTIRIKLANATRDLNRAQRKNDQQREGITNTDPMFIDHNDRFSLRSYSKKVNDIELSLKEKNRDLFDINEIIQNNDSYFLSRTPQQLKDIIQIPQDDDLAREALKLMLNIAYLRKLDNKCRSVPIHEETDKQRIKREKHEKIIIMFHQIITQVHAQRPGLLV